MSTLPLLTDELKQWIGREFNYTAPEEIGRASIRYFALAVGDENPLYFDDQYARNAGYAGIIAPPTFVCETNQYAHRQPNDDGYIGHSWDLPLTGCRMIRGGHEYELFQPVTPDDRIKVNWRLKDISEHRSSRGNPMLIVTALANIVNQRGEPLACNRETLIFQELEPGNPSSGGSVAAESGTQSSTSSPATPAATPWHSEATATTSTSLYVGQRMPHLERKIDLVRMIAYAGATWDWARLHYDPAYVAERKLPAPVIDGQMLGALISEALLDWLGPRAFLCKLNFRLRAMVFAGDPVRCEGELTSLTDLGESRLISVTHRVCVGSRLVADGSATVRYAI